MALSKQAIFRFSVSEAARSVGIERSIWSTWDYACPFLLELGFSAWYERISKMICTILAATKSYGPEFMDYMAAF